ncbi:MAG TPA: riboflavin synthase [Stenotrophobium sp.]|jgi:riboflavin synthase|nr:riboflavin synthase [Stenotrophobium sp.]
MFTGIIEAVGKISESVSTGGDRRMLIVAPAGYLGTAQGGDSIAVNGVCLTAVEFRHDGFVADVSGETLSATTAGQWQAGHAVNLERALTPSKPLGGHLVSGHVDGVGTLAGKHEDARSWRLEFEAPASLARYIARKGSICIDGISLTVNEVSGRRFGVNIIPQTMTHTTLGALPIGGAVNLEVDLVARYLERLLKAREEL